MQFSQEAIKEFKVLYQKECGEKLSDAEALALATSFFNFMQAVYRPLPGGACCNPACTVCLSCDNNQDQESEGNK